MDSSQSITPQDFADQRSLIDSIVVNYWKAKAGDFAVVLHSTQVHVNITFDQFDSFVNLQRAISALPFMDPISSGSDLGKLFNTTFSKTPEVFLLLKKETKATYTNGYKVPDGKLKGVKKIAVTFGAESNIKDISDFHSVLQYDDTTKFSESSVINKITETLCYGTSASYVNRKEFLIS